MITILALYYTKNSTLTIGVVYRSPNIVQEEDVKLQKAIREVSKGECVIMGDFNHGHNFYTSVSTSNTGLFPCSTCLGTNQRWDSSDHNQIHFNIKVKTGNTYKNNGGGTSTKANIKR